MSLGEVSKNFSMQSSTKEEEEMVMACWSGGDIKRGVKLIKA